MFSYIVYKDNRRRSINVDKARKIQEALANPSASLSQTQNEFLDSIDKVVITEPIKKIQPISRITAWETDREVL